MNLVFALAKNKMTCSRARVGQVQAGVGQRQVSARGVRGRSKGRCRSGVDAGQGHVFVRDTKTDQNGYG